MSKCAPQESLRNLDASYSRYYDRCQQKKAGTWHGKVGYPQPKSKKKGLGSFRFTGRIVIFPNAIQLPRLGRLRLKERDYLPVSGMPGVRVLSATVSEHGGHWYVSVQVEQAQEIPSNSGPVVGVDLGIKMLATISDGTQHERVANPKHLKRRLKKVKRLHKALTRKEKGSQNRKKAAAHLGNTYRRIANQRAQTLHQLTTYLAKTKSVIVIEDLNVSGMLKNHYLAQAIADVGFGEFRRQLDYKARWYGSRVVIVSRWEPSSKRCSRCGQMKAELPLSVRTYDCEACGFTLDRDVNAAINLCHVAESKLADSSPDSQNACGEERAGLPRESQVKRSSAKQEPNTRYSLAE